MPEGLEAEIYRRAATRLVGRTVTRVDGDPAVVAPGVPDALAGARVTAADRIGKLVLLGTDGPTVGLHFGMTGRLVVDDHAPIERLEYGAGRDAPRWDRFVAELADGGRVRINDPRRWARVTLDPDTSVLGPDVLSLPREALAAALGGRRGVLKAVLLDQRRIAGLGNLCVDEVLFHAGIAPDRTAGELSGEEIDALHTAIATRLPAMLAAGGSHRGVLSPEARAAVPPCPRDGRGLRRATVAGRTTVWCPAHQR